MVDAARDPPFLAALLLVACAAEGPEMRSPDGALPAVAARATLVGSHMRAALACHLPVSTTAQDRAAIIEAAALRIQEHEGGAAGRDSYLASLAPPSVAAGREGRERSAWCAARRADIERVSRWLDSDDGAAFAARVEMVSKF